MWWRTVHCKISCNILNKINDFSMTEAKEMLPLVEPISKKKSSYTNAPNRKDPANIDEKMLNKSEIIKMPEVRHITSENKYTTTT